jgi:hypothetical protein
MVMYSLIAAHSTGFFGTCRLWVFDIDQAVYRVPLAGPVGEVEAEVLDVELPLLTLRPFQVSAEGVCLYGTMDSPTDIYRVHIRTTSSSSSSSNSSSSSVEIRWPPGCQAPADTFLLGCSKDGSLLIAAGQLEEHCTHLFHVSPAGEATLVVGDPDQQQPEGAASHNYEWVDSCGGWTGRTPEVRLKKCQFDASGHLIGFTEDGHVVRHEFSKPVPAAHLQADISSVEEEGISFPSCEAAQVGQDWATLLISGDEADVQLRCAEGAVVRAHSLVLLARWEYYRVLQRNIARGMAGGVVQGEVDVSQHLLPPFSWCCSTCILAGCSWHQQGRAHLAMQEGQQTQAARTRAATAARDRVRARHKAQSNPQCKQAAAARLTTPFQGQPCHLVVY